MNHLFFKGVQKHITCPFLNNTDKKHNTQTFKVYSTNIALQTTPHPNSSPTTIVFSAF